MMFRVFMCLLTTWFSSGAVAGERINQLLMAVGTGPQAHSDQHNSLVALDYNFYLFQRSQRSGFILGAGVTHLTTDANSNTQINAFSFYPQLTLWPVAPALHGSYFFVRALGPSYLSQNWLGNRQQMHHFAFQAQVGIGYRQQLDRDKAVLVQLSFKHFSNGNLFNTNDGIDIPFVFTLGLAF